MGGHMLKDCTCCFRIEMEIKYDDDRPDGRHKTSVNVATDEDSFL